jgi:murein L,D-transpeptidase YafK
MQKVSIYKTLNLSNIVLMLVVSILLSSCATRQGAIKKIIELPKSEVVKKQKNKYGYFESINNIIVVDKIKKTITLYKNNDKILKFDVVVGKYKGDKIKEGDKKTPSGAYLLVSKLSKDTFLSEFYGDYAFVLDYPSEYDIANNKTGYGIWLHGWAKRKKRNHFSLGCVVLKNDKMKIIETLIKDTKKLQSQQNAYSMQSQQNTQESILISYNKPMYAKYSHIMNVLKYLKNKQLYEKGVNIVVYPNEANKYIYRVIFLTPTHKQDYFFEIIKNKAVRV